MYTRQDLLRCLEAMDINPRGVLLVHSSMKAIGEVEALNYLVKPVTREKLFAVLSRAAERLAVEPPYVLAASDGETVKLYESELVIHAKGREYRVREPISAFEERLSADFFRVHRSYLVNLKAVRRIGRTSVALEGGAEVPVARGKYDDINRAFIARN